MTNKLPSLSDFLVLCGAAGLIYGLGLVYPPLRWIVGGLGLIGAGILSERGKR